MVIVFPVSAADQHLVPPLLQVITKLGPVGNHTAFISSTPTAVASAQHLFAGLKGLFSEVRIAVLKNEPLGGWPDACNIHFRDTVKLIYDDPELRTRPWYWFEVDNTPLKKDWVNLLQGEYNVAGLPFMGMVHPTHFTGPPGPNGEPTYVQRDSHMVGTGIYPGDLWDRSTMLHYMVQPFDVELQYEVVPHCHHTNSIQHNWCSGEYVRAKNGRITCKSLHPYRSPINHAMPLRSDAVVLHGCKDGSLAEIVLRKRNLD